MTPSAHELVLDLEPAVTAENGFLYRVTVVAGAAPDGHWNAWLEFVSSDKTIAPARRERYVDLATPHRGHCDRDSLPGMAMSLSLGHEPAEAQKVEIPATATTLEGIPTVRIDSHKQA